MPSTDTRAALELRAAAEQVERWWLEEGQHHFQGAPAAMFALRDALARSAPDERGEGDAQVAEAVEACESIRALLAKGGYRPDLAFRDLPGCVESGEIALTYWYKETKRLEGASPPAPVEGERAPTSFGARLREVRVSTGWSLRELAAALGITPERLSAVERGVAAPDIAVSLDSGVSASLLASFPAPSAPEEEP